MLRAIIIDDELPVQQMLHGALTAYCTQVEVVGLANSVQSAIDEIIAKRPDLIFLDINLPDGSGFDLLSKLGNQMPLVVFITAYDEYAIKAFKFSAVDYILKPINIDELVDAVRKCIDQKERDNLTEKLKILIRNTNEAPSGDKKIVLKTSESIHIVKVSEIVRCESDHNYTTFHFTNHKPILVSKTLKEFDDLLSDQGFFRTHQTHLININRISRFDKAFGGELIMEDGSRVPVSKRKRDELFKLFENI